MSVCMFTVNTHLSLRDTIVDYFFIFILKYGMILFLFGLGSGSGRGKIDFK